MDSGSDAFVEDRTSRNEHSDLAIAEDRPPKGSSIWKSFAGKGAPPAAAANGSIATHRTEVQDMSIQECVCADNIGTASASWFSAGARFPSQVG